MLLLMTVACSRTHVLPRYATNPRCVEDRATGIYNLEAALPSRPISISYNTSKQATTSSLFYLESFPCTTFQSHLHSASYLHRFLVRFDIRNQYLQPIHLLLSLLQGNIIFLHLSEVSFDQYLVSFSQAPTFHTFRTLLPVNSPKAYFNTSIPRLFRIHIHISITFLISYTMGRGGYN